MDMELPEEDASPTGGNSGTDVKTLEKSTPSAGGSRTPNRLTMSQREVLTKFLASNIECALGHPSKIRDPDERRKVTLLWQELTYKLNGVDGPQKTTSQWQDTFHRLKCQLKTKLFSLKSAGQEEMRHKLTPLDVKLLSIFKTAESRNENLKVKQSPATTASDNETEIIVLEGDEETETPEGAELSLQNDGDVSEVHFIQLEDGSVDAVAAVAVSVPRSQITVEDTRDPLELSPTPTPPPASQPPRPRSFQRRRFSIPHRHIKTNQPSTPPVPPASPPAPLIKPTPQKSLQKEAREAEKRMINSLFQRLIESYEASNELKAKELELLAKEKESREFERLKKEFVPPDGDEAFLRTLLPYMKKLSDVGRLKLRSDFQILLMQALQAEPDDSPVKRSKKL